VPRFRTIRVDDLDQDDLDSLSADLKASGQKGDTIRHVLDLILAAVRTLEEARQGSGECCHAGHSSSRRGCRVRSAHARSGEGHDCHGRDHHPQLRHNAPGGRADRGAAESCADCDGPTSTATSSPSPSSSTTRETESWGSRNQRPGRSGASGWTTSPSRL
jgi:hypothetical protein